MNTGVLPYYTVISSLLRGSSNFGFGYAKLNIWIQNEVELTPELYASLSSVQSDYIVSFSMSVLANANVNADLWAKIYLLLVLNPSCKGQKIVPIFSDNEQFENNLNIGILKTYLNEQGITETEFPIFNFTRSDNQTVGNCSLILLQNQSNYLQKDLGENTLPAGTLIIASIDALNNQITLSDLEKQLAFYEAHNLSCVTILNGYIEKEEFESERKLWRKRTLVYQDFLSLSKKVQEKEYYEVLDWYHKEHEILPLWYKQFGHIIKVLMGKRSFRSLFDDNVKKYKD